MQSGWIVWFQLGARRDLRTIQQMAGRSHSQRQCEKFGRPRWDCVEICRFTVETNAQRELCWHTANRRMHRKHLWVILLLELRSLSTHNSQFIGWSVISNQYIIYIQCKYMILFSFHTRCQAYQLNKIACKRIRWREIVKCWILDRYLWNWPSTIIDWHRNWWEINYYLLIVFHKNTSSLLWWK